VSSGEAFGGLLNDFLLEAQERLGRLEDLLLAAADGGGLGEDAAAEVKLQLHTLKGNSGIVGLRELQALAHELEDLAESLGTASPATAELLRGVDRFRRLLRSETALDADGSVRVAFPALDALVDLLGEVVIHRNRLTDALQRHREELGAAGLRLEGLEAVRGASDLLVGTLNRLREGVMGLRMVPLRTLFRSLACIVHD